jgi:hypothetical protein
LPDDRRSADRPEAELSEHTRDREIAGLVEAAGAIGAKSGVVITAADDSELHHDGVKIAVAPVWRWLLETPPVVSRQVAQWHSGTRGIARN